MTNFLKSEPCIVDREFEVGSRTYKLRKIHETDLTGAEYYEYYLLTGARELLAGFTATLNQKKGEPAMLHLSCGEVCGNTRKENAKTLSVLLKECYEDLMQVDKKGIIVVDQVENEDDLTKFQKACLKFDNNFVVTALDHVLNGGKQEVLFIDKDRVEREYARLEYLNAHEQERE